MTENTDEAIKRMMAEDELDAAREGLAKMTVIEYARARSMQPQLIYYYIRAGHIKQEPCICGRKVIDVASADGYLKQKEASDLERSGGVKADGVL